MIYAKFDKNGYIIEFVKTKTEGYVEVPNLNCRLVNGNIVDETQKVLNQEKIRKLTNWFDSYFSKQLEQSLWQDDFKVSKDPYFKDENGQPKTYANIDELKAQAKIFRDEIRNLRK